MKTLIQAYKYNLKNFNNRDLNSIKVMDWLPENLFTTVLYWYHYLFLITSFIIWVYLSVFQIYIFAIFLFFHVKIAAIREFSILLNQLVQIYLYLINHCIKIFYQFPVYILNSISNLHHNCHHIYYTQQLSLFSYYFHYFSILNGYTEQAILYVYLLVF